MIHTMAQCSLDVSFGSFGIFVRNISSVSVFSHPVSLLCEKASYNFLDDINSEFYHI